MKNQSYDQIETQEPKIQAKELMEEIFPLAEEYFVGETSFDGQGIVYRLPNGQRFRITASEI